MRSRGAERPDDDADSPNEGGRRGRRFGRVRPEPVVPEEVSQEALDYEDQEGFVLRRLRAGASIYGTYPLEGEALAAYLAEKAQRP